MKMFRFGLLAALVMVAGACTTTGEQDETTRDENGAIVEAGEVGVFALNVGDCFVDLPSGLVESMEAVPCADEHYVEIYDTFDVDLLAFSDGEIDTKAGDGCLASFESYVGVSYDVSFYDFSVLTPTADSWELGDREVVCLLYPYGSDEPTTGTAKGSKLTLPDAPAADS